MARYEFLAEHAIFRSDNFPDSMQEQVINRVVRNENEYSFLNKATLRTKAQILTTGLWIKVFDDTYKKQIELIKDGGKKADTGYPQLLNNSKKAFLILMILLLFRRKIFCYLCQRNLFFYKYP